MLWNDTIYASSNQSGIKVTDILIQGAYSALQS